MNWASFDPPEERVSTRLAIPDEASSARSPSTGAHCAPLDTLTANVTDASKHLKSELVGADALVGARSRHQPVFIPLCGLRKAMVIPAKERHPVPRYGAGIHPRGPCHQSLDNRETNAIFNTGGEGGNPHDIFRTQRSGVMNQMRLSAETVPYPRRQRSTLDSSSRKE